MKAPGANEDLSRQIVTFVHRLRAMDLFKQPGVAETIDWANALMQLNAIALNADTVSNTLGVLLKYQDDIQKLQGGEASAFWMKSAKNWRRLINARRAGKCNAGSPHPGMAG
jgi:hypothetical protein